MLGIQIKRAKRRGGPLDVPFTVTVTTAQFNVHAVGVGREGTDTVGVSGRGFTVGTCAREACQLSQVLRHAGLSTRRLALTGAGAFGVTATFFTTATGICSKCVAGFGTGRAVFLMRTQ